jgi:hypothetical protein
MTLLIFPFSAYAAKGLNKLNNIKRRKIKASSLILLISAIIGLGYASGTFSYMSNEAVNKTIPNNLVQSSISFNQINDTVLALHWLDHQATNNSSLMSEERFSAWVQLSLSTPIKLHVYTNTDQSFNNALKASLSNESKTVYLIWYTNSPPPNFTRIYVQNEISIYRYAGHP